jgi:hypothetical protein
VSQRDAWQRSPQGRKFGEAAALVLGWSIVMALVVLVWAGVFWAVRDIIR